MRCDGHALAMIKICFHCSVALTKRRDGQKDYVKYHIIYVGVCHIYNMGFMRSSSVNEMIYESETRQNLTIACMIPLGLLHAV